MKVYLIAKKLSHSFSKPIHNELSDYSYEYKELSENELEAFFEKGDFDGLNVTIPYKREVMKYLDVISPEAKEIDAVNTVLKKDGKLYGYNTDYYGFCYMIEEADIDLKNKNVVILGRGGAARTVESVCRDKGAKSVSFLTRDNKENIHLFKDAQVIVNATPVGMYPDTMKCFIDIADFKKCEATVDLIYNPSFTKLMLDSKKLGIKCTGGLSMLVAQAKRASEIFSGRSINDKEIIRICKMIESKTKNIVLIGMPGSGKTTVGKRLAEILGREFFDSDEEISKMGRAPSEIIEKDGEEAFRKIETKVLSELCKKSGCVIATGGGCVTVEENCDILRQNGSVIFIEREISSLDTKGRPLSAGGKERLDLLWKQREPLYRSFCDVIVGNEESIAKAAEKILNALNKR